MDRGRLEKLFYRGKGLDMSGDPALSNRARVRNLLSFLRRPPHLATPPMLLLELQVPFVLDVPSVPKAPQGQ